MGLFDWIGRSVDELMKLGYPESVAKRISSGELPMDEASRMARAAEQGYDPRTYYHGGSTDIFELDPTKASDVKTAGTGTWFAEQPEISNSYLKPNDMIYPVRIKTSGMDKLDAGGDVWNRIQGPRITRDGEVLSYDGFPYFNAGDVESVDDLARLSAQTGGKGLVIDNLVDLGPNYRMPRETKDDWIGWLLDYEQKGGRNVAVQDPTAVRSVNAAFDPEYTGSNILGSRMAPTAAAGLLGAMALTQSEDAEAGKLGDISNSLWWHGSDDAFRTFDPNKLGTGEGGRDSSYGFYFGKKPATAESYLFNNQQINPKTFEEVFGLSLEAAQSRLDDTLKAYTERLGISAEDALDWNSPNSIYSLKNKMKYPEAKQYSAMSSNLMPSTYEFGARGKGSRAWLTDQRQGYLMGAELPSGDAMKYVDMSGEAWDEGKQALIAKMARDEGYQGVVFQNMVDDAFSGSGADDIALVFDPADINTRQVKPINMPDVDFSKLKSGIAPTAGAGLLGAMALSPEDAMAMESGMPAAVQAAGQSAMDAKPDLGRDAGTVLGLLDFLLPLVGEAFKPATMGNAELTDEQRRMRSYYGQ